MPSPIVTTKFFRPALRTGEVARPRLYQKLDLHLNAGCQLFLVSAPPGFGKTTLVSAWTRKINHPTAWLSLEKADNEPFRFWRYVIAAFRTIFSNIRPELVEILKSPQLPPLDYIISILVNFLATCQAPFFLVLDDYHLIETHEIHESLESFLDHLPANGRVILITRSDPTLHLARRRSREQLCEVRVADLRFNQDEAGAFFHRSMQLNLSQDDVTILESRTEGWVTGLQLAAISLRDSEDPRAFITAFHGENRFIADYLVEEVLQRQPVHIQQFLMETSLFQRLNTPLCNAITLRNDSDLILSRLEADNLFLIPLDTQRGWFRYHHLFARLLNKKLELASGPEAVATLLRRASGECIRQGLLVEGVQYLLDSGDTAEAAALIFRLSHELFDENELPTLMRWASQIPEKIVAQMPGLCIAFGWAAHATGHPEQSGHFVEWIEKSCGLSVDQFLSMTLAEQHLLPEETLAGIVEAVVIKARLLIDQGITPQTLEQYLQILPWLCAERDGEPYANNSPSAMRPIMLFQAGMPYDLLGDPMRASQAYAESIHLSQQLHNHFLVALGMGYLGKIQAAQGRFSLAERTWKDALSYAQENGMQRDAFFSVSQAGLGSLAYERNDLETAERLLREAILLARSWAAWQGLVPSYTCLALTLHAAGDFQGAWETLESLHIYKPSAPQMIAPPEEACRALLLSRRGQSAEAVLVLQRLKPQTMERDLILAEALNTAGFLEEAEVLLERLAKDSQDAGLEGHSIHILALQAVVLSKKDQPELAQAAFEKALLLGAKEGYQRTFLDLGEPAILLLRQVNQPIIAAYRARLFKAFGQMNISPGTLLEQANGRLSEPLTSREMEILQRIAQGADNAALAEEYTISINTVKKHVSHLFEKLDVANRLQAVEKARRLGILP